ALARERKVFRLDRGEVLVEAAAACGRVLAENDGTGETVGRDSGAVRREARPDEQIAASTGAETQRASREPAAVPVLVLEREAGRLGAAEALPVVAFPEGVRFGPARGAARGRPGPDEANAELLLEVRCPAGADHLDQLAAPRADHVDRLEDVDRHAARHAG